MENTKGYWVALPTGYVENISKEVIRKDLDALIINVYAALEEAPRLAKQNFFEPQNEKIDQFLINDIIRFYVKRFLTKFQFDVLEDYEVDNLANNGLRVRYNGYHVRILKADNGELPIPGISESKKKFYAQQLTLDSLGFKDSENHLRPNILLLWELDYKYDFKQLYLACPKSGDKTRKSVTSYFNEVIELPVPSSGAITISEESDELDITRINIAETEKPKVDNEGLNDIRG